VGHYFQPTRVFQILKHAVRLNSPDGLTMYTSVDSVIYRDEIIKLCTEIPIFVDKSPMFSSQRNHNKEEEHENNDENTNIDTAHSQQTPSWRPIFIAIPTRLGTTNLNLDYVPDLKLMFKLRQTMGIVGGKPRKSLYFVGFQDDFLIYLDPHTVKKNKSTTRPIFVCKLSLYYSTITSFFKIRPIAGSRISMYFKR